MSNKRWQSVIKKQKSIQQKIKNTKGVGEFLSADVEKGYMRDNISKNIVKIEECKDSTLRRYEKLLTKYYYLATNASERKTINDKLDEVVAEINRRNKIQ